MGVVCAQADSPHQDTTCAQKENGMSNARKRQRSSNRGNPAAHATATAPRTASPRAICWSSNSPHAETGYGTQTAQVTRRLHAAGHKVALASNYGLEGTTTTWEGMTHFPRGFDMYSNDVVPAYMAAWSHEHPNLDPLLITLFDVWVFKGRAWDSVKQIASWVPIDHFPLPPAVREWCARDNVTPIAMSRFGQQMLEQAKIESLYVPHAIDTNVYKYGDTFDTDTGTQMTGREFMNVPADAFVYGVVSANKGVNPCRKSFPEMFLAFAMIAQRHDDAVMYVHTDARGVMGGLDLMALAKACGIAQDRIVFADPFVWQMGVPQFVMSAVYSSMDVLVQTSMGEGFGIPAIEAQATGTPVIVTNATAQPELVGEGWTVDGQPYWDSAQKAWLVTPKVEDIVEAMEAAYQRGRQRSNKAVDFAQQYDADQVFTQHWVPVLDQLS